MKLQPYNVSLSNNIEIVRPIYILLIITMHLRALLRSNVPVRRRLRAQNNLEHNSCICDEKAISIFHEFCLHFDLRL